MNSYFNAGYHDWQSPELHHYAANRFCGSPSLPTTATTCTSSQGNLYAPNNGYHSYMHHHAAAAAAAAASPQLNSYASNMGYGALPPSPPSSHSRYGDNTTATASASAVGSTSRAAIFGGHHPHAHHHPHHSATSAALSHSFSNASNLQSHLYGDHIVFGNLSTHYPVSANELAYSEIAANSQQQLQQQQQQQSASCSEHLVGNESSLRDGSSPESHLPSAGDKSASEGECSASENGSAGGAGAGGAGHIIYPPVCQLAKLSSGNGNSVPSYLDTSPILGSGSTSAGGLKDGSSQHTFEDSSPSSTPDLSSGPSSALQHQQQSSKAFFPWMKSYTGKPLFC